MSWFSKRWNWLERKAPWLAEDLGKACGWAKAQPRGRSWLAFGAAVALLLLWAWWPSCEGDGSVKDTLACSQVDRNYGLLVAGLFALVALYLNWQRTDNDRRRTVNDTYVKAVEQLGHKSMEVRLGAIYALERIAATDRDYHWPIMETLCAYIRERPSSSWGETAPEEKSELAEFASLVAKALPPTSERNDDAITDTAEASEQPAEGDRLEPAGRGEDANRVRPPTDIQAIFTVFARRSDQRREWEKTRLYRLDLRRAEFQGAILMDVDLHNADLTDANLRGANLSSANLTRAYLWDANLTDAILTRADLTRANLWDADLRSADLRDANLTDANLWDAHLKDAYLRSANLTGADLRFANLTGANLTGADLTGADLRVANLTGADLTDANVKGAKFTRSPAELGAVWDDDNPP